ncbi:TadE/TadG family type IV pilus assembly protein [Novosphingobium sp. M1R2S20]|uniref:TadE/TadG family type IV pilus assembly protein n=1 Tax=Novosphingobium rhizovicinum TaxID=3228928 RepID=A0ABV3RCZ6_9SPHN
MIEFALIMPFFLIIGLWGVELAHYSYQTMRVGQLAAHVADNASRIGDYSTLQNRKIYESDIDDLLIGVDLQAGPKMELFDRGRVIISSLEVNGAGQQYIHWQRCLGTRPVWSSYGKEGDLKPGGLGPVGSEVFASPNDAVMFVELQYEYNPLISSTFIGTPVISSIASFTVRSSRDLSRVYQTSPASPKMTCDKFTSLVS